VPHGVDAERFAAVDLEGLPGDVSDIPRPIAGFVGRIASWIDLELIRDCALALPEWSFVLVGPTNTALSELEAMPNVHCLGARDYEEVPGYVRAFDVCLAPFVSSALSESVNPLKVHEYLAAGKPVVATRMRELEPFADVVRLEKRSVFPEAIEDEAIRDSADRAMQRRASVTRTWSDVAETILDLLESAKAGEGEPLSSAGDRPVVDRVYRGRRCSEAGR
jgi:glycosyltransferase involved in cell wall biosynthesis